MTMTKQALLLRLAQVVSLEQREQLRQTWNRNVSSPAAFLPHERVGKVSIEEAEANNDTGRAAVVRPGLMAAPEGRLGLAALRVFVDARDSLAAAELALLQEHAGDPDAWLDAVLAPRADDAAVFAEAPMHAAFEAARARVPSAGPLAALDAALEAIGARETCLRWGRAAERHANLDALRAHAVSYASACKAEGAAATPTGLVDFLEGL